MAFEVFPLEEELISLFGTSPEIFGDTVVTYTREGMGETLYCSFSPDYGDMDITLLQQQEKKIVLSLSYIQRVEIRREKGTEQLQVSFQPSTHLRDFILVIQPKVSIVWGTTVDKDPF